MQDDERADVQHRTQASRPHLKPQIFPSNVEGSLRATSCRPSITRLPQLLPEASELILTLRAQYSFWVLLLFAMSGQGDLRSLPPSAPPAAIPRLAALWAINFIKFDPYF